MDDTTASRRNKPTVREATEFDATAFVFDGRGGVKQVDFTSGPIEPPSRGFLLVAGSLSSPEFRAWLHGHLDPHAAEGLTATDQHSRCTVVDDKALVVLRIVRPKSDPENLRFVRFYRMPSRIMYPAPRIVCSKGRSKPLSILERSREICTSMTLVCGSK